MAIVAIGQQKGRTAIFRHFIHKDKSKAKYSFPISVYVDQNLAQIGSTLKKIDMTPSRESIKEILSMEKEDSHWYQTFTAPKVVLI